MKTVNIFIGKLVLLLVFLSANLVASSQTTPQNANYVLVVTDLISFSGKWKDNKVSLECKLAQDHTVKKIHIERSRGNGQFEKIAEINPEGTTGFSYVDPIAPESDNLYRIALYKRDNNYAYSKTLKFDNKKSLTLALQVYPTVITGSATLSVSSFKQTKATLQITDMNGQTVSSQALTLQQGTTVSDLDNVNTLAPGHYMVVLNSETERITQRIIVSK